METPDQKAKAVYWSVIETVMFDNGETYGKVLFVGSETECERFSTDYHAKLKAQGGGFIELPRFFQGHRCVGIQVNTLCTFTKPSIYRIVQIGTASLQ